MNCLLTGIVLTTGLYLSDNNPKTRSAAPYLASATYQTCGIKPQVDSKIQDFQEKYLPKYLQKVAVHGTFVYRLVKDHKIEYTWSF